MRNIALWKARLRRLVTLESLPAWVVALSDKIYKAVNAFSNADWVRQHLNLSVIWAFVYDHGSTFTTVTGVAWLAYLVVRPEKAAARLGEHYGDKRNELPQIAIPPAVTIYTHVNAAESNRLLSRQIEDLFRTSGWDTSLTYTEVPKHANGLWIHGGTQAEQSSALWGLSTLRLTPEIDHEDDNPPTLQVIVGAGASRGSFQPAPAIQERKIEWVTPEQKMAAEAVNPPDAKPIPDGEFEWGEKKDRDGALIVKVRNLKAEPKSDYMLRIVDVKIWSDKLENRGGFAPYPPFLQFAKNGIQTIESNGRKGLIDHIEPKRFELISNPGVGPWHLRGQRSEHLTLRDGVWQVMVEFHWAGFMTPASYTFKLSTKNREKNADFVSPNLSNAEGN